MTDFTSISRADLTARRKRLRWQRRLRAAQSAWRLMVVMGLAGGAIWAMTLPGWVIRSAAQIEIEGNEFLSADAVRSLLPIIYPKSLWELESNSMARQVEAKGPIAKAVVTRHLFPPSLTVAVQERRPVAIAYPATAANPSQSPSAGATASNSPVGLLDTTGAWISLENYTTIDPSISLPTLKVIGIDRQYRTQWATLYHDLDAYQTRSANPVKILEINWSNPANLILITELGSVHLGTYDIRFPDQLRALTQMRQLPEKIDLAQLAYIDLTNPKTPLVQMQGEASEINPSTNPVSTSAPADLAPADPSGHDSYGSDQYGQNDGQNDGQDDAASAPSTSLSGW
jgi:cell division protein FtsQ